MKEGWDYLEYLNFVNHFFLQEMLDFDYLGDVASSSDAMTVIGE